MPGGLPAPGSLPARVPDVSAQGPRLLLVEDDPRIRRALSLALQDEGFAVAECGSGEQALTTPMRDVDLVLLDLMLPGVDGFTVCEALRRRGDVPIIMVTARSASADVVRGLEAGADDYVTKPLAGVEVAARIRALLRRTHPRHEPVTVDGLLIDQGAGVVSRDGADIPLTKTEFRLLCELVNNRPNVVTREQLLERVWGYDYFGDTRLLDVHVRRLRVKVEPDPGAPTLVYTVRGVGYRWASHSERA